MKDKTLLQILGVIAGLGIFIYGFGFYKCYFSGWPIVQKLCTGPNGGEASYQGGSYWDAEGDRCVITFKQGDSMVSYDVDLESETAQMVNNQSLVHETKYKMLF